MKDKETKMNHHSKKKLSKEKAITRKKARDKGEESYKKSVAEGMALNRSNKKCDSKTFEGRNRLFRESVRYGRDFPCICCERLLFRNGVKVYSQDYHDALNLKFENITSKAVGSIDLNKDIKILYICLTCKRYIERGKIPPMSNRNSLTLLNLSDYEELKVTELENAMIALNIIFQKVFKLPKSRWPGMKDKTINIPIYESDILNTIEALPRTPTEAGIVPINFKRKKEYKNNHIVQFVSVPKIMNALKTLKEMGNRYYQFVPISTHFEDECKENDLEGFNFLFPEDEFFDEKEDELQQDLPDENRLEAKSNSQNSIYGYKPSIELGLNTNYDQVGDEIEKDEI